MVQGDRVVVANTGDSRAVLCRESGVACDLSIDHKPELEAEQARIKRAGAVITNGRVNGSLNMTRAIGDLHLKTNRSLALGDQAVTARPDVSSVKLTETDEFLVLACDGVWEVMSSQAVVDFIRPRLQRAAAAAAAAEAAATASPPGEEAAGLPGDGNGIGNGIGNGAIPGSSVQAIAGELLDACVAENAEGHNEEGAGLDNMSVIIVVLTNGRRCRQPLLKPCFPEYKTQELRLQRQWHQELQTAIAKQQGQHHPSSAVAGVPMPSTVRSARSNSHNSRRSGGGGSAAASATAAVAAVAAAAAAATTAGPAAAAGSEPNSPRTDDSPSTSRNRRRLGSVAQLPDQEDAEKEEDEEGGGWRGEARGEVAMAGASRSPSRERSEPRRARARRGSVGRKRRALSEPYFDDLMGTPTMAPTPRSPSPEPAVVGMVEEEGEEEQKGGGQEVISR